MESPFVIAIFNILHSFQPSNMTPQEIQIVAKYIAFVLRKSCFEKTKQMCEMRRRSSYPENNVYVHPAGVTEDGSGNMN
jgi:hypothetical protein